jgi:hypothetical protein
MTANRSGFLWWNSISISVAGLERPDAFNCREPNSMRYKLRSCKVMDFSVLVHFYSIKKAKIVKSTKIARRSFKTMAWPQDKARVVSGNVPSQPGDNKIENKGIENGLKILEVAIKLKVEYFLTIH